MVQRVSEWLVVNSFAAGIVNQMSMAGGEARLVNRRTLFEFYFTVAAIATTAAAIAEVIGTGVFGTGRADTRRFFFANTT